MVNDADRRFQHVELLGQIACGISIQRNSRDYFLISFWQSFDKPLNIVPGERLFGGRADTDGQFCELAWKHMVSTSPS